MNDVELHGILDFLRDAEQLKDTLRNAFTASGRHESTAEHTWRLCLMVMVFSTHLKDLDLLKLMKMCIVHDLGEAISGDIAAIHQISGNDKAEQERRDLETLIQTLPNQTKNEILSLWDEYDRAETREASFAKAFDKLETILQHTQGKNPEDFNYLFNLTYGKQYTDADDLTARIRSMLDRETERLAQINGVKS